jgi:type I restriction enzyme S subunit
MRHAAVPLDDIVTIAGGGTPSTNRPEYFRGRIPWVSPKDMKCWDIADSIDHVTEEAIANSSTNLIARDAVLIVIRSGVLKHTLPVAINRVPVTLNQDMKALICGDRVIPDYLARALQALSSKLLQTVRGTTADNISTDVLRALEIPLPPLPEQRRIAGQLEQADRLRRIRRYALELTETFLPAAFLEVFGDPFAAPSAELVRLEDVLEVDPQNGLYVPAGRYVANGDPHGTEMVHMSDLFGGIVTPGKLKRALLETSEISKYQLSERDLLVARRSLAYEGAAQPCRVPALKTPLVFESSMIRIRPNGSRLLAVYLYYYLTNRAVRENRVRPYVTISTISGINQDNLCRIEVVVPPLDLQQKFAALVERVERMRAVQREAMRQAEHLFASLLNRAFSV